MFGGCVWYLCVEWDDQLHAVVGNEGRDVLFSQLPILRPHKVCSALIKLANTKFHLIHGLLKDAARPTSRHRVAAESPHSYVFEEHHSVALYFILLEHLWTGRHGELLIRLDQINFFEHFGLLTLCILTQM